MGQEGKGYIVVVAVFFSCQSEGSRKIRSFFKRMFTASTGVGAGGGDRGFRMQEGHEENGGVSGSKVNKVGM